VFSDLSSEPRKSDEFLEQIVGEYAETHPEFARSHPSLSRADGISISSQLSSGQDSTVGGTPGVGQRMMGGATSIDSRSGLLPMNEPRIPGVRDSRISEEREDIALNPVIEEREEDHTSPIHKPQSYGQKTKGNGVVPVMVLDSGNDNPRDSAAEAIPPSERQRERQYQRLSLGVDRTKPAKGGKGTKTHGTKTVLSKISIFFQSTHCVSIFESLYSVSTIYMDFVLVF